MNKKTTSRRTRHTDTEKSGQDRNQAVHVGDGTLAAFPLRGRRIEVDSLGRVRLNDIHKAGGFTKNQSPGDWTRLEVTQRLVTKALEKTTGKSRNWEKSQFRSVLCSKVGAAGGVWAHRNLALAYAKYLSADLHYEVNEVFLRAKSGDAVLADEILEKASPEANAWAGARAMGRAERRGYTDTLQSHGVTDWGYGGCTNAIYQGLYGMNAGGLRAKKGAAKALRDAFDAKELAFTAAAEHLASERIKEEGRFGNLDCREASGLSAANLRKAIETDRASRKKAA